MRIGKAFSVFGLTDEFRRELATLVKDEVQLAKVEFTEKINVAKRNAIALGIGVFVSFAGLVILSLALGRLLSLAFQGLDWSPALSNFVGITAAGLVIALVGLVFLLKGVKTLSKSSLKPERTIETLKDLRGGNHHTSGKDHIAEKAKAPSPPQPSKEELEARIDQTRGQLKHTMAKARKRAAWGTAASVVGRHARRHPLRLIAIGAGAGLARRAMKRRREKQLHA